MVRFVVIYTFLPHVTFLMSETDIWWGKERPDDLLLVDGSQSAHQRKLHTQSHGFIDYCVCVSFVSSEYYYEQEDGSDEEAEPTFSEDEAVSQKGLRRSQSVKITRSRVRKDVSVHLTLLTGKILKIHSWRDRQGIYLHTISIRQKKEKI